MQIFKKFFLKFFSNNRKVQVGNKEIELELVYTDSNGNKWRSPKDLSEYPFVRLNMIQTYSRYADLKMDSQRLHTIVDNALNCLNKGEEHDAIILLNEVKVAENLFCEKNTLLKLASAMFLINDEKANSFNDNYEKLKIDTMLNDAECMAFFLPIAYQTLTNFKNNSSLQVVEYLMKTQPLIDRLNYIIQSTSPE